MPIAFLGALALLATRTCSSELAKVTLIFSFGDAAADVRAVEVEVFRPGDRETLARFKQRFGPDGASKPVSWKLQLSPGMYTLEFRVDVAGKLRQFEKSVRAVDDSEIAVDLGRDLRPRARASE